MNNAIEFVNVSAPNNPNFTSVSLPALPTGYKWKSQFLPVDIFGGPYRDTWELRIEDANNNIVAIDYAVHESYENKPYPTMDDYNSSAVHVFGIFAKFLANREENLPEEELVMTRREFFRFIFDKFRA